MATGDFLTWAVQAQDAPAHVARILQTIILEEGVVDKTGGSFQVQEDTGTNMQIQVGSGVLGDLAVVEGDDGAGQGSYVHEAQNATVTRVISASDPSQDRIDLVVLQNYDDEADSSGLNDAEVEVIEGTPAGSPSAPALPASAIPLAEILVGAGVTAITNANITDRRAEVKQQFSLVGTIARKLSRSAAQSIADNTETTVTFPSDDYALGENIPFVGGQATLPADGIVLMTAYVQFTSNSTGRRRLIIRRNSSEVVSDNRDAPSTNPSATVSTVISATDGDTVDVRVLQNSGGALDVVQAEFTITYLRPKF